MKGLVFTVARFFAAANSCILFPQMRRVFCALNGTAYCQEK